MNTPPPDLDELGLSAVVGEAWGLTVASLEYVPRGFGSHHWDLRTETGERFFVTVDELDNKSWFGRDRDIVAARLRHALTTAQKLRQRGLLFVVAPLTTRGGEECRRLNDRYTVSMFPWIDGQAGRWGQRVELEQRDTIVALIAELHQARVDRATLRTCQLELPDRDALEQALAEIDRRWLGGPFSEPARAQLANRRHDVRAMLAELDRLEVMIRGETTVLTHGEPHPGNVIWTADGPALIDWDTVGLAPKERDLWMFGAAEDLVTYAAQTGAKVNRQGLAFYRIMWELTDLASFVVMFRGPHERNADAEKAWNGMARYLDGSGPLGRELPWALSESKMSS